MLLTKSQQEKAINLAMQIETGTADYDQILKDFKKYPNLANNMLYFWYGFNEMTQNAIKILTEYKCRKHLEKCLRRNYWEAQCTTILKTIFQYVLQKLKMT